MSEINHFPTATHDGPSHTLEPSEMYTNNFGDQERPSLSMPPPRPPSLSMTRPPPLSMTRPPPPPRPPSLSMTRPPPLPLFMRRSQPPPLPLFMPRSRPPPQQYYTVDPNMLPTLPHRGQCSSDNAFMPESQSSTVPRLNMEFSSEEEAYEFYKNYAEQNGFKVRKGKVQRTSDRKVPHTSDGKAPINKRTFLCSNEGERSQKESVKTPKYRRKETRTGCKAEIRIELRNGKWVIYICSLGHNHELERPGQRHEMDTYPDNSQAVGRESIGDGAQVVDEEGGTAENRSPEEVRVSNYLPDKNVAKLPPDDVQSLLNCFSHLQAEDPSFFYAIQVNSENQMTSFFWRDGRSRIDYAYFADLLVLDTCSYQINNNVICAPFFGVNHHQDQVLFGCAFLLDESVASFGWLFRTFLEAMGNSQPKTLFTNLSEDIARAAEKEFPETKHRFVKRFIWEFYIKCLPISLTAGDGFLELFFECIHEDKSKQDFEKRWNLLMEEYELREHPWLAFVYKSREKWSPLFSEEVAFDADLELLLDLNNYLYIFPRGISEIATLSDALEKYIDKTEQLRLIELKSDSQIMPWERRLGMGEHAASVYTPEVLAGFELEFKGIVSLAMEEVSPGPTCVFKLKHFKGSEEEEVRFDCSSSTVSCSCKKFEREGILCSHSLKVLNAKNIFRIPEQYVLKRWTRSAKQGVEVKGNSARDNMDEKSRRLHSRNLMYKALNVITKSVATKRTREIVERHLDSALLETEFILKYEFRNGDSWGDDGDSRGDDEDNDEICCGEIHCPFGKRKKIGSSSSSDNEVHGS